MEPQAFLSFVADLLGVPASALSLETAYGSVPQWDSVMHLRLTMEVCEKFGADIPVDAIAGIRTLGQFYAYVK